MEKFFHVLNTKFSCFSPPASRHHRFYFFQKLNLSFTWHCAWRAYLSGLYLGLFNTATKLDSGYAIGITRCPYVRANFICYSLDRRVSVTGYLVTFTQGRQKHHVGILNTDNRNILATSFSGSSDMLECCKWQEIIHRHTSFAKYLSIYGVGTAVISRYLVSASVNVQPAGSRLNGFHVYFCTLFPYESKELIQAKLSFKIQKKFVHLLEIKGLSVHIQLT